MEKFRDSFLQNLETGFIDHQFPSNNKYLPQLIINDKKTERKVLTTLDFELRKCKEFWFSVAFATTSGIATLKNLFKELEEKKIRGKILVSQYQNFTHPEALINLLKFKNIELKIAVNNNFHSKGYLFNHEDHYNLIIGSSNLTADALCKNIEWNLKISAISNSSIISNSISEFKSEFQKAITVDEKFISYYKQIYDKQFKYSQEVKDKIKNEIEWKIEPNSMQVEALENIKKLRSENKNKALLISATGTGKTYLSAFVGKLLNPNKFLFVVHRENIASTALKTFQTIFGNSKTVGFYTGGKKNIDSDFIFSTVQTISKEEHFQNFDKKHFDYIVIDETHRAGAKSYEKMLNYFCPKFLLGMTATPERTDGYDIFKLFDHNIAYEIRLNRAMEEDMLCPFHYYGVTDISVDGITLEDNSDFSLLTSDERVKHIIEKSMFYDTDDGKIRGLVFCSTIKECQTLSDKFNKLGIKSVSLTGKSSELERKNAITSLESDDYEEKIKYIFSVDIFNEGIDIPRVNQIIMLRPTQSAIIFIQQLGRGLRKAPYKDYLTVIDFIGNYSNNYLVPIALYGDTSYNKDTLRKLISSGSSLIPGSSTINFDKITRDRIYKSIDSASMSLQKDLVNDYNLLKFKLGRIPMMMDFLEHGSRDPQLYVNYSKSYFNFVKKYDDTFKLAIDSRKQKLLELFSNEINNSKRNEECIILKEIVKNEQVSIPDLKNIIKNKYKYDVSDETIDSCILNLNFGFVTEKQNGQLRPVRDIYEIKIIRKENNRLVAELLLKNCLTDTLFKKFLEDSIEYSIKEFDNKYDPDKFFKGFSLYQKYSRKDVFRILNWEKNPVAQNVGGYIISPDNTNCPIFVNYHKEDNISESTKYEDRFVNNFEFEWMSKANRTLESPDVKSIINHKNKLRLPLFVKKSNDEGLEFYYMGDIIPIKDSSEQTTISNDKGRNVPIVKMRFNMKYPVEEAIYYYITNTLI